MLRALTEVAPASVHSVSPSHAGWIGTTSGAPSGPTVARCAHMLSPAANVLISSSGMSSPMARTLRPARRSGLAGDRPPLRQRDQLAVGGRERGVDPDGVAE